MFKHTWVLFKKLLESLSFYTVVKNDEEPKIEKPTKCLVPIMGLLHYPTCKGQLGVSTWSKVERMHDLPQMTHLEVGTT